jgi:trk system potassium uptake protein TrkA
MEKRMNVIVVGCGRVGSQLANRLSQKGHHVTVVDVAPSAFENLDTNFRGRTLEGDVLTQDLLRRAGIEQADALAAVTNSDTLNVVVGRVAHTVYNVTSVVCRNYEPRYRSLYDTFNLQEISSALWGAQRMEEMLEDASLRTVFSAGDGEVEVYEVMIPRPWHGHSLRDLLGDCACLVALTRAGKASLPTFDTLLEYGDILHLSATLEGIEKLRGRLAQGKEA